MRHEYAARTVAIHLLNNVIPETVACVSETHDFEFLTLNKCSTLEGLHRPKRNLANSSKYSEELLQQLQERKVEDLLGKLVQEFHRHGM